MMEFGKKGDAKKAMKLHHKEGITLKEAWKRVKKGRKSTKKGRAASPKKKRCAACGPTLKQLLRKMNKFGDTVCSQGYEPNPGWERRPGQQQCIKECGVFEVRDQISRRCVNAIKYGQKSGMISLPSGKELGPTGRLRNVCLPPNMRDPRNNRCVKPTAPIILKPGYEINPDTMRPRKMCLPGQYRDLISGRCRTIRPVLQPLIAPIVVGSRVMGVDPFPMKRSSFGTCTTCR